MKRGLYALLLTFLVSVSYASNCNLSKQLFDHLGSMNMTSICDGRVLSVHINSMPSNGIQIYIPKADHLVQEQYPFRGLAHFYLKNHIYFLNHKGVIPAFSHGTLDTSWWVLQGRFKSLMIYAPGALLSLNKDKITLNFSKKQAWKLYYGDTNGFYMASDPMFNIRFLSYGYLNHWIAHACVWIQDILIWLYAYIHSWGLTVIIFSILIKICLLPIGLKIQSWQQQVARIQKDLYPKIEAIKNKFRGEEAHNRIMKLHHEVGVSPFYALKPIWGALLQVPILVLVFNTLGQMSQFDGRHFLWIKNLAYPDVLFPGFINIPYIGRGVHGMVLCMSLVTVLSTCFFQSEHFSEKTLKNNKRNLYMMAGLFLILFYPFPSVMVLFWTMNNVLQWCQQKVFGR